MGGADESVTSSRLTRLRWEAGHLCRLILTDVRCFPWTALSSHGAMESEQAIVAAIQRIDPPYYFESQE